MSELVRLELPEDVARSVREVAARTYRRMEDVLVDWIDGVVAELPVETLSDDQVLRLCDLQMETDQQEELNVLLARDREARLEGGERQRLEELLRLYRLSVVRRGRALRVAVERGLNDSQTRQLDHTRESTRHLKHNERAALDEFVSRLRQVYAEDLLHVVLYGSKARGDSDEDSDLDLLIVLRILESDYLEHRQRILDLSCDLDLEYGVLLSPRVRTDVEYSEMRRANLLLNREIQRDGIEL